MKAIEEIVEFQRMIVEPGQEATDLYLKLIAEETNEYEKATTLGNKIKEACDVLVVTIGYFISTKREPCERYGDFVWPLFKLKLHSEYLNFLIETLGEESTNTALSIVNKSNMSKFLISFREVEISQAWYLDRGIKTYAKHVPGYEEFIGVYSECEQEVIDDDGEKKKYGKDKLLKGEPFYTPVDESKLERLVK